MVSVAVLSRGLLVAVLFLGFLPTVLSMTHISCYILVVLKDGRRRHTQQRYSSGAAGGSEPVLVLILREPASERSTRSGQKDRGHASRYCTDMEFTLHVQYTWY